MLTEAAGLVGCDEMTAKRIAINKKRVLRLVKQELQQAGRALGVTFKVLSMTALGDRGLSCIERKQLTGRTSSRCPGS